MTIGIVTSALNLTGHHPARRMQDIFFSVGNLVNHVLRTQTSNVQVRQMEGKNHHFGVIAPGKVLQRSDGILPLSSGRGWCDHFRIVFLSHLKFVLLSAARTHFMEFGTSISHVLFPVYRAKFRSGCELSYLFRKIDGMSCVQRERDGLRLVVQR